MLHKCMEIADSAEMASIVELTAQQWKMSAKASTLRTQHAIEAYRVGCLKSGHEAADIRTEAASVSLLCHANYHASCSLDINGTLETLQDGTVSRNLSRGRLTK